MVAKRKPARRRTGNPWIKKRGSVYVIVQKGTGKVLSRHRTKALAESSFRAMEASKHGW